MSNADGFVFQGDAPVTDPPRIVTEPADRNRSRWFVGEFISSPGAWIIVNTEAFWDGEIQ